MVHAIIEENRKWLDVYCVIIRIIGWLILGGAGIWIVVGLIDLSWGGDVLAKAWDARRAILMWVLGISRMCVFAMIMLGVAQLIEFLSGSQHQRGRILRQGDKLLFLYAGLLTLSNIAWAVVVDVSSTFSPRWQSLVYAPFLLGQILILVGAAYILRRVIPIIEESKTLV